MSVDLPLPRLPPPSGVGGRRGAIMVDRFGRVARDLRVSLTDRCNLRCTYCMPAEGLSWLPKPELLTDDELLRVVGVAVGLGVEEVRFTGGEPLLRPGLPGLVAGTAALSPRPRISLTTNGIGLGRMAAELAAAGLDRINVSLDTIRPERFATLTRRDRLDDVLLGLRAAADAGLAPVKVNAVLMRGVNEDEAPELLRYCLEQGYHLRFIEQMPLESGHQIWGREDMVTAQEILAVLQRDFDLTSMGATDRGSDPAERWQVDGGPGTVGIIASVTRPFCGDCDRVRVTADGQVRNCLFAHDEDDLRTVLRAGGSDEALADVFLRSIAAKRAGHGMDDPGFVPPDRPMSAIGG